LKGAILMNTIIQQLFEKIIKENTTNMEELFTGHKDISLYISATKQMLDQVGAKLIKTVLEMGDEIIRESNTRKKSWYIQRRNDPKTLLTTFGAVDYERTYYKHKKKSEYAYLSDHSLGIDPHDRMDLSYQSELINQSLDLSYEKSSRNVSKEVLVSKQTVMNSIRNLGIVGNDSVSIKEKNKIVPVLYIEADEDHVAMQDGSNKQIKLIYVHEGKELVSPGRAKLINKRYFTGSQMNSEDLWLEVANYIDQAYKVDQIETIYLSGDGAKWIKEGLNWIPKSKYVLDYFHLSKYIKKATAHLPHFTSDLWDSIHCHDKKRVRELFKQILEETEKETKKTAVQDSRRYILNNWVGIINRYDTSYIGCSAEGHISHILSARLSSRPLGWSIEGADQMAYLRVYRENGGEIYDALKQKKENNKKQERIMKLDQRIMKKKMNQVVNESINNITLLNTGKRTWAREYLKSIRGA